MNIGTVIGLIKAYVPGVDPSVIEGAVADYLEAHPEATTTVQDGSITEVKLATALATKIGEIDTLSSAIENHDDILETSLVGTKNLNKTPYDASRTAGDLIFTANADNSVTVNGKSTGTWYFASASENIPYRFPLPAGTYTLSGGKVHNKQLTSIILYANATTTTAIADYSTAPNTRTFTVDVDCYAVVRFFIASGEELNNETFYPQLEAGSTATEYVSPWGTTKVSDRLNEYDKYFDQTDAKRFEVPGYYFANNYLPGKINRVNALASACAGNGDAWVFITDMHWIQNAKVSPNLLNYVYKNTHIEKLFGGGDYCHNSNQDNNWLELMSTLRDAWPGKRYYTVGNHEFMGNNPVMTNSDYTYILNAYGTERVGDLSKNYYYVDNTQQKIRYIVLARYQPNNGAADESVPDADQITWLSGTALNVTSDWTVVVIVHDLYRFVVPSGEYDASVVLSYQSAINVVNALDTFVQNGGNVACICCGEHHFDMINYTPQGIPIFTTTCDKNTSGGETALPITDQWAVRTSGTKSEQAFDVMVLDKTSRKVTAVRIGYQARNSLEGEYGTLVEEREVSY